MGAPPETAPEKDRMSTPIFADILGHPHDTVDMAHASSYDYLLHVELREILGIPESPRDTPELIALRWLAENRGTATTVLETAMLRLSERGITPLPAGSPIR